jgi:hypothetical protein
MRKSAAIAATAAFVMGGIVGSRTLLVSIPMHLGSAAVPPDRPVWTEVAWPFIVDQWGKGKAFQCKAADCGVEVNFYIRAKIGFYNCTAGVSDDDELDRLSDFSLMGDKLSMLGPGVTRRCRFG